MKKITLLILAFFVFQSGALLAQNYDTVSGATQKADAKTMNLEQFKKVLQAESKRMVFCTVNADGTPNAGVYGSFTNIEKNVFAVNSMADTKTTKININRNKIAMLVVTLTEKNEDGFDGAKVVLKPVTKASKVKAYRTKMEKSSEKTTFFTVEKFLIYR